MGAFEALGRHIGAPWGLFGPVPLELPWVSWLGPERYIRKSMFVYSVSDTHFGVLGASLDPLGVILESLGAYLGALGASLGFIAGPRTLCTPRPFCL